MHTLYTTDALILGSYPQGESSRVFRLLTKSHGLLYAHGQSVREVRNRNRYALRTASLSTVTLVRGRETWRITSAQHAAEEGLSTQKQICERKILALVARFVPREDPTSELFTLLARARASFRKQDELYAPTIEALTTIRILHTLGYVASHIHGHVLEDLIVNTTYTTPILEIAKTHQYAVVSVVNSALEGASW